VWYIKLTGELKNVPFVSIKICKILSRVDRKLQKTALQDYKAVLPLHDMHKKNLAITPAGATARSGKLFACY
jgi:hypothetical protein